MSTLKTNILDTPSGSGNITVNRPMTLTAGDIVTADLANDAVTTVKIVDDAVTIAKLAATGTASSSTFLRGDNAWAAAGGVATGFIGGLTITNNGSDGDHDIDIAVGSARDYTDAVTMTQGTVALTKRIDATWVVGDGNGGLDSTDTVANNTGYGVYLIRRSGTGVVDVMFSTDMTAAGSALTLPTNYDQKRLIGWVRTDGSANITAFTQVGDYFRLTGAVFTEVNDNTLTSDAFETLTMTVPPLSMAHIYAYHDNTSTSSANSRFFIKTKGAAEAGSVSTTAWSFSGHSGTFDAIASIGEVLVDSASQIEYAAYESDGTAAVLINLFGCWLLTRSNP